MSLLLGLPDLSGPAIVVAATADGAPGLNNLLARVIAWRVRARWYGIALGLPMVFGLAAAVLHELLGAPTTDRLGEVSALGLIAFVLVGRPALYVDDRWWAARSDPSHTA